MGLVGQVDQKGRTDSFGQNVINRKMELMDQMGQKSQVFLMYQIDGLAGSKWSNWSDNTKRPNVSERSD